VVVGDDVAIFRNEEAGPLSDRAQVALVVRILLLVLAALLAAALLLLELAEELLQRVIVRKVIEAAAETERIILVGNRVDTGFDANRHDGRRNGIHYIGEARNLRRLNVDGIGIGTGTTAGTPVAKAATARPATTEAFIAVLRDKVSLIFLNICELPFRFSSDLRRAKPAMVHHKEDIGHGTLQRTVRPMKNS